MLEEFLKKQEELLNQKRQLELTNSQMAKQLQRITASITMLKNEITDLVDQWISLSGAIASNGTIDIAYFGGERESAYYDIRLCKEHKKIGKIVRSRLISSVECKINEEYRGKGYGYQVLCLFSDYLERLGEKDFLIPLTRDNERAIKIIQKYGGEEIVNEGKTNDTNVVLYRCPTRKMDDKDRVVEDEKSKTDRERKRRLIKNEVDELNKKFKAKLEMKKEYEGFISPIMAQNNLKLARLEKELESVNKKVLGFAEPVKSNDVIDLRKSKTKPDTYYIYRHNENVAVGEISDFGTDGESDVTFMVDEEYRHHHYALEGLKLYSEILAEKGMVSFRIACDKENSAALRTAIGYGYSDTQKVGDFIIFNCPTTKQKKDASDKKIVK